MEPTKRMIRVRPAQSDDKDALGELRHALWPASSAEAHAQEVSPVLAGGTYGTLPLVNLVAEDANGTLVGFLEIGLRSHADGCDPSRPVGYVEGWYVVETHRGRKIGAQLMAAAEDWARAQGCREIASDTWIDYTGSQRAHEALGFEVVDRCVHYRKAL